uniref:Uncharacterized protein n=1 Tax=Oryza rufipogon TaxID=4529 RepID=A0A0E0PVW7_ORYRU
MAGDDASASAAVHAQSVASTAGDGASARAAKGRAFVSAVRSNVAAVAAPNPPPNLAGHLAAVRRQVCPAGYHLAVIKLSHLVGARCSSLVSGPSRVVRGPAHPPGPLRGRGRGMFSTRPPLRGRGRAKKSGSGGGGVLAQPVPDPPCCQPYPRDCDLGTHIAKNTGEEALEEREALVRVEAVERVAGGGGGGGGGRVVHVACHGGEREGDEPRGAALGEAGHDDVVGAGNEAPPQGHGRRDVDLRQPEAPVEA